MDFRKKMKQRLYLAVAYLAVGLILVFTGIVTGTDNSFFTAFGFALVIMGILRIIRHRKIMRDDQSLRKQELAESDDRLRMIAERARSWVFSLSVTGAGLLVIILNILGHHDAALPFAWYVCGMVVLYWICYSVIDKKY